MGGRIFSIFFVGSTLYMLMNRGGVHTLEKLNFTTSSSEDFLDKEPYRVYLDCKRIANTGHYDPDTNTTIYNLYNEYTLKDIQGFQTIGAVMPNGKYIEKTLTNADEGQLILPDNLTEKNIVLGIPYVFHIELSPIYLHQYDKQTSSPFALTDGRLQLRYIKVNYADTGYFLVSVKNNNTAGTKCKYKMTARNIGTETARLGVIPCDTGIFKVPVQMLNTACMITIDSDMPLPLSLIGFLWEGSWVQYSKGV